MKKKAAAGERFITRWLTVGPFAGTPDFVLKSMSRKLNRLLACERDIVAEDVLAMAYESGAVNGKSYHTLKAAIHAKYGTRKAKP